MKDDIIIISRHHGLVDWLSSQGISGRVIAHATAADVSGKHVYGALPLHLAALALSVTAIDMPSLPSELRGKELTPEQMDEAGAALRRYVISGEPEDLDPLETGKKVLEGFGYSVSIGGFGYDSVHVQIYDQDTLVREAYYGR